MEGIDTILNFHTQVLLVSGGLYIIEGDPYGPLSSTEVSLQNDVTQM